MRPTATLPFLGSSLFVETKVREEHVEGLASTGLRGNPCLDDAPLEPLCAAFDRGKVPDIVVTLFGSPSA